MKHIKKYQIFERYKEPKNYMTNDFGWDVPIYTYVDKVFDDIIHIITTEKGISEKDFTNYDNTRNYIEMYFDNNQEILLEIDKFNQEKKRPRYCAEYLYDNHFGVIYNMIINTNENISDRTPGKEGLKNSKSIPSEMKPEIEKYININSYYINKKVLELTIPKIKGKQFKGVSLGADKNGFFVNTHRARSKSYKEVKDIPQKDIKFIETTG